MQNDFQPFPQPNLQVYVFARFANCPSDTVNAIFPSDLLSLIKNARSNTRPAQNIEEFGDLGGEGGVGDFKAADSFLEAVKADPFF
ncbi:MAG: hypothetical protein ABFD58_12090, partial [Anaerolineaceae bacterium]